MQVQAIFVYDRFAEKVSAISQEINIVIPQNIVMRMGVFFSKFALGHEEKPTVNFRQQTGYFNEVSFSHRGIRYNLHFALILDGGVCEIQLTIYAHARAIIDTQFPVDTLLALSSRPMSIEVQVDSTIESIKRDLSRLYHRIPQNEEMLGEAIKEACLKNISHFKNHLNGTVRLTYYNELFKVYDNALNFTRVFHLPSLYAKLQHPVLNDYLLIGSPLPYNFEPTFNNADTYKVVGTKKELLQFIKDDFRLSVRIPMILQRLLNHEYYHFKDILEFKVGSYDRPVITVTRKKLSSHKKIHYIINNNIVKSLTEI